MVNVSTFNDINIIIYKRHLFINNIKRVCMCINGAKDCPRLHKKYIIAVFQSKLGTVNAREGTSAIRDDISYVLHKQMTVRKIKCTIWFIKEKQR